MAAHGAVLAHVVNTGPAGSVQIGVNVTPATISGSVKDAATGLPITDAQILACGGFGYCGNSASVDQTGSYSLSTNAGTYYVFAVANGYVAEVYPNAACLPGSYAYDISHCPAERAQTVVLTDGSTLTNTDFSLSVGHSIRGDVRGAANQPLNWAWVWIYDDAGNALTAGFTDSAGHYAFSVLPDASYKLVAKADGYTAQMYYQVNCGNSCNLSLASPATVAGADIGGANFALTQQAAVFGTVTGTGGKPLQNSNVSVVDGNGTVYANGWTDQYGHYSAGPLSPGNYYVYASSQGYFSQILNGIDCGPDCLKSGGTPTGVTIATPAQQVEADFALDPLPLVTGHISDRVSGHPLANVTIAVSNTPPANFVEIANTVSDVNGNYTLASVPAGTYYVWALSPDHIDEVYPNLPCENSDTYFFSSTPCSVVGATLLTITPGQAPGAFDFSLNPSSSIGGTALISAGAGSDLSAGVAVAVYDDTGTSVGSATPDTSGHYVVNDLPPGTYFAAAVNDSTYVEQIWQQIDCPEDCAPTTGTPIVLSQGSEAEADFTVTRRNAVVGRVTDPTGAPIPGALVDLFDTANGMYFASGVADAQGYYVAAGNLGHDYFLGTEAGPGYYDQVYAGIACPLGAAYYGLCPLTNATAVPLSASSMQPHIVNFVLQSNDPIFANGFE
ncbi:MAG TPA: carboxypeptidase regulatory-like domain-containing protein [Rudaea sp.]|nr:carboxypeptidase regulatory-like domain-containing protein [Rudaea sp.]